MPPSGRVTSAPFRLCLYGQGRVAAVRRFWANADEGAEAIVRDILRDAPDTTGFELGGCRRKIAEERKRAPRP